MRTVPLFWSVPREVMPQLLPLLLPAHAAPSDIVIRKGSVTSDLFILLDGHCISFDAEVPLQQFGPGDFFGEAALLEKGAHAASFLAVTFVKMLTLSKRACLLLAPQWAELAQELSSTCFLRDREDSARRRQLDWATGRSEDSQRAPGAVADGGEGGGDDDGEGGEDDENLDEILRLQAEEQRRAESILLGGVPPPPAAVGAASDGDGDGVPRTNSGSAEAQLAISQIKEARAAQAAAEAKLALLSRAAQAALGRDADAGADAAELAAALEKVGARGA